MGGDYRLWVVLQRKGAGAKHAAPPILQFSILVHLLHRICQFYERKQLFHFAQAMLGGRITPLHIPLFTSN
jgi:hypothetical protein